MLTTAAALRGATKHYKTFALGPVDLAVPLSLCKKNKTDLHLK